MTDDYHDLQQSYGRCLRDHGFIERFYVTLLASDPRIPPMFARTDMGRQRVSMRRGISVAILYAAGSPLAQRSVEKMADAHSKAGHVPVSPELHAHWLESLLKVIADTDPEINATLLARWRQAMGVVIDTFTRHYRATPASGRS